MLIGGRGGGGGGETNKQLKPRVKCFQGSMDDAVQNTLQLLHTEVLQDDRKG